MPESVLQRGGAYCKEEVEEHWVHESVLQRGAKRNAYCQEVVDQGLRYCQEVVEEHWVHEVVEDM